MTYARRGGGTRSQPAQRACTRQLRLNGTPACRIATKRASPLVDREGRSIQIHPVSPFGPGATVPGLRARTDPDVTKQWAVALSELPSIDTTSINRAEFTASDRLRWIVNRSTRIVAGRPGQRPSRDRATSGFSKQNHERRSSPAQRGNRKAPELSASKQGNGYSAPSG